MSRSESYRCGTVAIVGRPNVGKSTLLNRLLGQKIAIVSSKPETTRDRLLGILTLPQAQFLFLDTPGIYQGAKTLLGTHQIRVAREALHGADCLLLMTEAQHGFLDEDKQIVRMITTGKKDSRPVFCAINKIDRIDKRKLLAHIDQAQKFYPFQEILPISATKGDNIEALLHSLIQALPRGPALYPADHVTDKPVRELVQELIREKTLRFTHDEIPHGIAVMIEEWRAATKPTAPATELSSGRGTPGIYIRATIYVERESQKGILIGKNGALLKRIGQEARRDIEQLIEGPVFLDLWVKVAHEWRKNPLKLKEFGY